MRMNKISIMFKRSHWTKSLLNTQTYRGNRSNDQISIYQIPG
jgi:hypothetical protein